MSLGRTLHALSSWATVTLLVGACVGLPPPPPSTDEGSSSSGEVVGSSGSDVMTMPMTDTGDSGSGTTAPATTTPATTTPATTTEGTGPVCPLAELGATCADAECDCASGNCFVVGPLGGVCSECDEDADCAATTGFGCNFGNPLTMIPAVCSTTGGIGEGCSSADVCAAGLFCPTIIDVPGILTVSTCSECETNGNCMGGQSCAPSYDIANLGGFHQCVDPGSIPNDEGCNLTSNGSECASGQCASATLMGIPVAAVCSPCNEDGDCMSGTCMLPEVQTNGDTLEILPGMCV